MKCGSYLYYEKNDSKSVSVLYSGNNREDSVDEESWNANEEQKVVQHGNGMMVMIQTGNLPVSPKSGYNHQRQNNHFCNPVDEDRQLYVTSENKQYNPNETLIK